MKKIKLSLLVSIGMFASLFLSPLSVKAFTISDGLNLAGNLYNSAGKVIIKDTLKVTKNILANGVIKNTKTDSPVTIDDGLTVTGNLIMQGVNYLSNLKFSKTNISLIDTASLESGEVYFNETDNKLYLYNGSTWVDLTQQDTDTDTNTTYTAGNNISIDNGVITANIIEYTEGDNIDITGNRISATNTTYTATGGIAQNFEEFSLDSTYSPEWAGLTLTGLAGYPYVDCDATHNGYIFYNDDNHLICFCNGTDWLYVHNNGSCDYL
jgi:hypothetical protein